MPKMGYPHEEKDLSVKPFQQDHHNSAHLKVSLKTLRGPFNIYPHFFFQESWDRTWVELLGLAPDAFRKENIQMLERSPMAYLELKDKQVLILSKIKDCIELLKAYRMRDQEKEKEKEKTHPLKIRIERELHATTALISTHFNEKNPHYLENKTFVLLGLSYITFCEALLESGNRSRKSMAVAHSFLLEIKEEGKTHPYFSYYEALLLIGRNKWDEATALLHVTLKEEHEKGGHQKNTIFLVKLLCKLYIHIDMPHVANFMGKRYLRGLLKEEKVHTKERTYKDFVAKSAA